MPTVHFGRKKEPGFQVEQRKDLIAVRTRSRRSATRFPGGVPTPHAGSLDAAILVVAYPEAGVEVYQVPTGKNVKSVASRKSALRQSQDVRFAGGVLVDPATKEPVLYTENIFIKFADNADPEDCEAVIQEE